MTIVYAIAVLGVLAIVFGLILAIAAKVFEVHFMGYHRHTRKTYQRRCTNSR